MKILIFFILLSSSSLIAEEEKDIAPNIDWDNTIIESRSDDLAHCKLVINYEIKNFGKYICSTKLAFYDKSKHKNLSGFTTKMTSSDSFTPRRWLNETIGVTKVEKEGITCNFHFSWGVDKTSNQYDKIIKIPWKAENVFEDENVIIKIQIEWIRKPSKENILKF